MAVTFSIFKILNFFLSKMLQTPYIDFFVLFCLNNGVVLKNPQKVVAHLKYRLIFIVELKFFFQHIDIYMLVVKLQTLTGLAVF